MTRFPRNMPAAPPRVALLVETSKVYGRWAKEQATLVRWLADRAKPVGVMACYDVMGLRMLDACRRMGLAVPEQVAVLGVDDDAAQAMRVIREQNRRNS